MSMLLVFLVALSGVLALDGPSLPPSLFIPGNITILGATPTSLTFRFPPLDPVTLNTTVVLCDTYVECTDATSAMEQGVPCTDTGLGPELTCGDLEADQDYFVAVVGVPVGNASDIFLAYEVRVGWTCVEQHDTCAGTDPDLPTPSPGGGAPITISEVLDLSFRVSFGVLPEASVFPNPKYRVFFSTAPIFTVSQALRAKACGTWTEYALANPQVCVTGVANTTFFVNVVVDLGPTAARRVYDQAKVTTCPLGMAPCSTPRPAPPHGKGIGVTGRKVAIGVVVGASVAAIIGIFAWLWMRPKDKELPARQGKEGLLEGQADQNHEL
jgi:hypothetical protein